MNLIQCFQTNCTIQMQIKHVQYSASNILEKALHIF